MKLWWIGALWIAIPSYVMALRTELVIRWEMRASWPFRTFARWRWEWMHIDPERPETWREYRVYGYIGLILAAAFFVASVVSWILNIPIRA